MEVQVVKRREFIIAGTVAVTKAAESKVICELWDSFEACRQEIKHKKTEVGYELHLPVQKNHFCLTGVEVTKVEDLPLKCFAKTIPAGEYAVFTHKFSQGGFPEAYKQMDEWIKENAPESAYTLFEVQVYDHRFKAMDDPGSEIEFLVPLVLEE